jgi:hypothetical protein
MARSPPRLPPPDPPVRLVRSPYEARPDMSQSPPGDDQDSEDEESFPPSPPAGLTEYLYPSAPRQPSGLPQAIERAREMTARLNAEPVSDNLDAENLTCS